MNFMKVTIRDLLTWGERVLDNAGIKNADVDAWRLLEYVTGIRRVAYLCDREQLCREEQAEQYRELIEKRSAHIPLQYLIGEQVFMGFSFLVNSNVLIPRQDTEILVEEVQKRLRPEMAVLDMCTGSGCILLSLVQNCKIKRAVGADLSWEALEVAKKNEERLCKDGLLKKIEWVHTDMFERIEGTFDCIIANPPYIATAVIETLEEEVRKYEPRLALDGREDGLSFYRILAKEAKDYLNLGGMLFLEIGYDQGRAVSSLLREQGFSQVQIKKDLAGWDRVCFGKLEGNLEL